MDKLLGLYEKLILTREAEEAIRREYPGNEIKSPVHLGNGGEAISVGVIEALPRGAKIFATYRNHAAYLTLSNDLDAFFGELYGRMTGCGKGKAGSMHLTSPEHGLLATSAVVATSIPVAVGAALTHQMRKDDAPVAVFFGDGAVEEGVFWESFNFACVKRLNILFVCEDNELAIHSLKHERQGFRSIEQVSAAFDCHFLSGDGSDILAVSELATKALSLQRNKPGPAFLYLPYFRLLEHVGIQEDFAAGYRVRPENLPEKWDPVIKFERLLLEKGVAKERLHEIRSKVLRRIAASIETARKAPPPPPEELFTDLLAPPGRVEDRLQ